MKQFTSVDQDGSGAPLSLYYDAGASAVVVSPLFGDGRVGQVPVGGDQRFASSFAFRLGTAAVDGVINSGGVDNIEVCRVTPPPTHPPTNPGTGTIGYWKNHPTAWPMTSIAVGGVTYTREQAIALMQRATKGDKTYNLFEQLVAAKLNVAAGNDASCISDDIAAADAWLRTNRVGSGVSASSAQWSAISATFTRLDQYNNGLLCAPHRD